MVRACVRVCTWELSSNCISVCVCMTAMTHPLCFFNSLLEDTDGLDRSHDPS